MGAPGPREGSYRANATQEASSLTTKGPFIVCLKENYWVHVTQIKRFEPAKMTANATKMCFPDGEYGIFILTSPQELWESMCEAHRWLLNGQPKGI